MKAAETGWKIDDWMERDPPSEKSEGGFFAVERLGREPMDRFSHKIALSVFFSLREIRQKQEEFPKKERSRGTLKTGDNTST